VNAKEFSPFEVAEPQVRFEEGAEVLLDAEPAIWDIAALKRSLLSLGGLYLDCARLIESSGSAEARQQAYSTQAVSLRHFLDKFQSQPGSDAFRSAAIAMAGRDLSFTTVNMLIGDLVKGSKGSVTLARAERLTLYEVARSLSISVPSGGPSANSGMAVVSKPKRPPKKPEIPKGWEQAFNHWEEFCTAMHRAEKRPTFLRYIPWIKHRCGYVITELDRFRKVKATYDRAMSRYESFIRKKRS